RQDARLRANAQQVRAAHAAHQALRVVAGRRLEARALLGVRAARLERRGCEPLGQLLLGLWPGTAERIETNATKHEWLFRRGGSAVSRFVPGLSRLEIPAGPWLGPVSRQEA